ncbi:hypothetical protein L9F63_001289, partial [Diploptera punctata]
KVVDTWPLADSPIPLICITITYLLFVLKLGPWIMEKRNPFSLNKVLIVYNFTLVLISLILTVWPISKKLILFLYQDGCHPRNGVPYSISYWSAVYTWFYLLSKICELTDTVFFVLRKKYNQVSFLHVFHHTIIMVLAWFHLKYLPGIQGVVMGFLNSGVHIFMYLYYMLAAMGPAYQKYVWWKKHMTRIQLIQFVIMGIYMSGLLIFNCEMPRPVSAYFIFISILFLLLFIDFYTKTYKKKTK